MFNTMVGISANKDRTHCYIKTVGDTDYFDDEGKLKDRDTHLLFNQNEIIIK